MLVEVADFSQLRRRLGVQRADLVAVDVAERVAAVLPGAMVGRVGRNLIEVSLSSEHADGADFAKRALQHAFLQPLLIDGEPHCLRLVIGGATALPGRLDEVSLVERAELALMDARDAPAELPAKATADREIGRELHAAIARDELFVHYQPKLHLRRQKIVSVEALIRWHHPQRGLVLPNDFIPHAERDGAIAAVTLWTVRQVIADQRVLIRNGYPLPVFINMAGALLSDASFIDEVIALIVNSGAKLGVEITETSVIGDPEGAIRHLQRLSDIGVVVTIDDYGAGLSSLAYLKQLPASELKIDKLFVTELTSTHRDPLIVRSTIDLAHALDMEVVAEGVETPASLALLSVMGCDMVQGYLISRPVALEALLAFLREDRHLAIAVAPRSPLERLAAVRARG
ncbi:GGDEF domain-containing phosphodiesterase [Sphingomonas bacterium]|uniref:GGDEF domain-containing phosphodiesterase n=1 Tax=Sphingomonas bacterium TaxID=1895847 RepID=UPI0026299723|nr:GGDEF domain-containing phosphodiesterase [Sphingomonas bacterium]